MTLPTRIFLDTNVYIIGFASPDTPEASILDWLIAHQTEADPVEIILSDELLVQVARVGRRILGKDWVGEALSQIWALKYLYVIVESSKIEDVIKSGQIPREDAGIYLTAKDGQAQCFISANHELIRAIAEKTGDFECLTPEGFVQKYLSSDTETN